MAIEREQAEAIAASIGPASGTAGNAIRGVIVAADDSAGQAWAETANCANSTAPMSVRQRVRRKWRVMTGGKEKSAIA